MEEIEAQIHPLDPKEFQHIVETEIQIAIGQANGLKRDIFSAIVVFFALFGLTVLIPIEFSLYFGINLIGTSLLGMIPIAAVVLYLGIRNVEKDHHEIVSSLSLTENAREARSCEIYHNLDYERLLSCHQPWFVAIILFDIVKCLAYLLGLLFEIFPINWIEIGLIVLDLLILIYFIHIVRYFDLLYLKDQIKDFFTVLFGLLVVILLEYVVAIFQEIPPFLVSFNTTMNSTIHNQLTDITLVHIPAQHPVTLLIIVIAIYFIILDLVSHALAAKEVAYKIIKLNYIRARINNVLTEISRDYDWRSLYGDFLTAKIHFPVYVSMFGFSSMTYLQLNITFEEIDKFQDAFIEYFAQKLKK